MNLSEQDSAFVKKESEVKMAQIIKKKTFAKVMRGYQPEEVDAYIDYLLKNYAAVSAENDENKRRLTAVLRKLQSLSENGDSEASSGNPVPSPESAAESQRIVEQAKEEAQRIIEDARKNAQDLVRTAQTEAREKAVTITAEARRSATQAEVYAKSQYESAQKLYQEVISFRDKLFGMYSEHIDMLETIAQDANEYYDLVADTEVSAAHPEEGFEEAIAEPMVEETDAAEEEVLAEEDDASEAFTEPAEDEIYEAEEVPAEEDDASEAFTEPVEDEIYAAEEEALAEEEESPEALTELAEDEIYEAEEEVPAEEEESPEALTELAEDEIYEAEEEASAKEEDASEALTELAEEGIFEAEEEFLAEDEASWEALTGSFLEKANAAEEYLAELDESDDDVFSFMDSAYPVTEDAGEYDTLFADDDEDEVGVGEIPDLGFMDDLDTDEDALDIRIDWKNKSVEFEEDEEDVSPEYFDEAVASGELEDDFHDLERLFSKEKSSTGELSLQDEFDIVYSSRNSMKNVEEIGKQPLVAPERPSNPKKHKRF